MTFNLDQIMNPNVGVPPRLLADPSSLMATQQPMNLLPQQMPQQIQQQQSPPSGLIGQIMDEYQKNQQPADGGLIQSILSGRFQPNMEDTQRSITQNAISYMNPGFVMNTPEQQATLRMGNELAPYTQAMDLQKGQEALTKASVDNQFLPKTLQADINAKNAQAGFMNNVGGAVAGGPKGDEFLASLPPQIGAQVKAIAEGRMALPGGFALKSPYWQQMLSAVSQYDPNFDAVNYNARNKTRASFTSGADANNITALNTALAHLGTLSTNYQALNNTSVPLVNAAINSTGNALGRFFPGGEQIQTNTANVGADAEAVSHELAKVFRSTGMSEGEIQAWKDKISVNASPSSSGATINSALDLIDGRLSALGEKYNQGMGTTKQGIDLLSPDAQKAYNKLRGLGQTQAVQNAPAGQNQSSARVVNFADLPQ